LTFCSLATFLIISSLTAQNTVHVKGRVVIESGQPIPRQLFPSIKKYDDNKRTGVSDYSGRPTSVCHLGDTYLLAAEAAIEAGHAADALPLITP